MPGFPGVVTHNYDPARGPFRNLCALPIPEAEAVLESIRRSGTRTIKPDYLQRRLDAETWLTTQSRLKLGETPLVRPIYFFLGDFADGLDRSRPHSFVLPLTALPPSAVTFTYPDSMSSLEIAA